MYMRLLPLITCKINSLPRTINNTPTASLPNINTNTNTTLNNNNNINSNNITTTRHSTTTTNNTTTTNINTTNTNNNSTYLARAHTAQGRWLLLQLLRPPLLQVDSRQVLVTNTLATLGTPDR
jgi:hypothetical protein